MILAIVAAFLAVAVAVSFLITPVYTASALVLVDPTQKNLLSSDDSSSYNSADSFRIDSEVEIIASDSVLLRVLNRPEVLGDQDVGVSMSLTSRLLTLLNLASPEPPDAREAVGQAMVRLRNAIDVQRRGLTYVISISATSADPARAASLANAVAETYIEQQLASKVSSALASRDLLQARMIDAQQDVTDSEIAFDAFLDENMSRLAGAPNAANAISGLRAEIDRVQASRGAAATTMANIAASLAQNDWDSLTAAIDTAAAAELGSQRSALLERIGRAETVEAAPLRQQLQTIEDRLRELAEDSQRRLLGAVADGEMTESNLRQTLRGTIVTNVTAPDLLTKIYSLQQKAELAIRQYDTLLARLQEVEAQAALQVPDSRIVSPALEPLDPSFPRKSLILALAGLSGLAFAMGLAFVYENYIGGFTSEEQAEQVLRLPVSTAIPAQRIKAGLKGPADLTHEAPLSAFPEAVRKLRIDLDKVLNRLPKTAGGAPGRVVMVSSAVPGEGKTTLALSLARSYAYSGRRVMVIDCDLRKPSLHLLVGSSPSEGLLEYLGAEDADLLSEIVAEDPFSEATLIFGARRSDVPTDQFLDSPKFEQILEIACNQYDIVIIDTPPINPVVDGQSIASLADAIIYVCRWGSTSQREAKQAVRTLSEAKKPDMPILVALNQQQVAHTIGKRKYGTYYAEAY